MNSFADKILKNSEVCEVLNVSDYERKQLIAAGILESPVDTGSAYPRHTLSQVSRAQARISERARPKPLNGNRAGRKTKPLSQKMLRSIRAAEQR